MNMDLNLDAILQENANIKPQALNFIVLTKTGEKCKKQAQVTLNQTNALIIC